MTNFVNVQYVALLTGAHFHQPRSTICNALQFTYVIYARSDQKQCIQAGFNFEEDARYNKRLSYPLKLLEVLSEKGDGVVWSGDAELNDAVPEDVLDPVTLDVGLALGERLLFLQAFHADVDVTPPLTQKTTLSFRPVWTHARSSTTQGPELTFLARVFYKWRKKLKERNITGYCFFLCSRPFLAC